MPLKLVVLSPGKVKEPWLVAGLEEYVKRLGRYCRVQIKIVADEPDSIPMDLILRREGERLLKQIQPQDFVVALDLKGLAKSSEQFASKMMTWFEKGGSQIVFVIGGANGLDSSVLTRANEHLSLSKLTWTHQMSRLLLLEQCYRAFRIINGEPYHK
ncbi:MAG: 23S rRNA (pseudouridine(1915)-N(3))-methyltransferase RlmH [Eubacteriales bacterium]|nr:23S rRNA (pseudouridine(1915)-N(3))-methyltransferase RlmH [Eubacteriales bacterium]